MTRFVAVVSLIRRQFVTWIGEKSDMSNAIIEPPCGKESHAASDSLECLPADLRLKFGWPKLLALVLDAVFAEGNANDTRHTKVLTLLVYCYASNVLGAEDIEFACREEADVSYIVEDELIPAAEVRAFRRHHREQLARCLARSFFAVSLFDHDAGKCTETDRVVLSASAWEFANRRLNLAVVFDTAMSE